MNWDQIEGKWTEFRGKVKEKWGKLTDDDLDVIGGHRDQLEGKLQQAYGRTKEQVKKEVDQAAVNNIQFIGIEVFFPAIPVYHRSEKQNSNNRRQKGYPVTGNEKESEKPDLGLWGEEFLFKPGLDQPVAIPGDSRGTIAPVIAASTVPAIA